MSDKVVVKTYFKEDVRRFTVPRAVTYGNLLDNVKKLYPGASLAIKYKDDEGDMVSITSDEELDEAIRLSLDQIPPILRIFLFGTIPKTKHVASLPPPTTTAVPTLSDPVPSSIKIISPISVVPLPTTTTVPTFSAPLLVPSPISSVSPVVNMTPSSSPIPIPIPSSVRESPPTSRVVKQPYIVHVPSPKAAVVKTPVPTSIVSVKPKEEPQRRISEVADECAKQTAAKCQELSRELSSSLSSLSSSVCSSLSSMTLPSTPSFSPSSSPPNDLEKITSETCQKIAGDLRVMVSALAKSTADTCRQFISPSSSLSSSPIQNYPVCTKQAEEISRECQELSKKMSALVLDTAAIMKGNLQEVDLLGQTRKEECNRLFQSTVDTADSLSKRTSATCNDLASSLVKHLMSL